MNLKKLNTASSLNRNIFLGVILALGVLLIYWQVLYNLFQQLAADEDFSYGLLLPLVSAYLVYLKWDELRRRPWRPSWLGLIFLALALMLLVSGKLVTEYYSMRLSFVIFTGGLIWLLGGWDIIRLLAIPLVLLILMLPLPGIITSTLTLPLQLISSRLAAGILQALGYPLVLEGNVIDLGVRQLQVVAACSGLRYILSLLALGIIYCYFYQRTVWKAAVLLIALIPAAILANALRVAAMGVYPSLQEGFWHGFTGWLIFVFCFSILALLNGALNRLQTRVAPVSGSPQVTESAAPPPTSRRPYFIAALAMIIVSGFFSYTVAQPLPVPLLQSFDKFPLNIGPWKGQRNFMDSEIFQKTEADDYFEATYTNSASATVSLYIAHYAKATQGGLGHNPGVCMRGSGWKTLAMKTWEIWPGQEVNYLVLQREFSPPLLVYWWNLHQGHWLALQGQNIWHQRLYKLYTLYHGLTQRRTDWAMIRLITPVEKDLASANERLTAFVRLISPILPQFIPSQTGQFSGANK
jgi:exosortase D (VPLPA-CTERM-specific)